MRRKKLEGLADREALKGRRARLQAMLIHKLGAKYAKKYVVQLIYFSNIFFVSVLFGNKKYKKIINHIPLPPHHDTHIHTCTYTLLKRSSAKREAIEELVSVFVEKTEHVTEKALVELETMVRERMAEMSGEEDDKAETGNTTSRKDEILTSRTNATSGAYTSRNALPPQLANDWILLDAFKSLEIEMEEKVD